PGAGDRGAAAGAPGRPAGGHGRWLSARRRTGRSGQRADAQGESMTIAELLAAARLPASDTPRLDAELLLAHCLGRERSYLYAWPERQVPAEAEARYRQLLARRAAGEPVAHLVGVREFWSLPLAV